MRFLRQQTKTTAFFVVLALAAFMVIPGVSSAMGNNNAKQGTIDTKQETIEQSRLTDCYRRNDCKLPVIATTVTAELCAKEGGNSWKDERGICHRDLGGK